MLCEIANGCDVPYRKLRRTFEQGFLDIRDFDAVLERPVVSALFDSMASTRPQFEEMPDGYRNAMTVQHRRNSFRVIR